MFVSLVELEPSVLKFSGGLLWSWVSRGATEELDLELGDRVKAVIKTAEGFVAKV